MSFYRDWIGTFSLPLSLYHTHINLVMTRKAVSLNTHESPSSHLNSSTTLLKQMAADGKNGAPRTWWHLFWVTLSINIRNASLLYVLSDYQLLLPSLHGHWRLKVWHTGNSSHIGHGGPQLTHYTPYKCAIKLNMLQNNQLNQNIVLSRHIITLKRIQHSFFLCFEEPHRDLFFCGN